MKCRISARHCPFGGLGPFPARLELYASSRPVVNAVAASPRAGRPVPSHPASEHLKNGRGGGRKCPDVLFLMLSMAAEGHVSGSRGPNAPGELLGFSDCAVPGPGRDGA